MFLEEKLKTILFYPIPFMSYLQVLCIFFMEAQKPVLMVLFQIMINNLP